MKVESYSVEGPCKPLWNGHAVVAMEGAQGMPIIYLRRPTGVKDDKCWETLVQSIRLALPCNFEVK